MRVRIVRCVVVLICAIAALSAMIWPACGLDLPGTPASPDSPNMFFPMNMFYGGQSAYAPRSNEAITLTISGNVYVDNVLVQGADVTVYVNDVQKAKAKADKTYAFAISNVHYGDKVEVMAVYGGMTGKTSMTVDKQSMVMDVRIAKDNSFMSTAINMLPANDETTSSQLSAIKAMQQNYQPHYTTPARTTSSWMSRFSNPSAINGVSNPAQNSYDTFVKYSPGMNNIFEV